MPTHRHTLSPAQVAAEVSCGPGGPSLVIIQCFKNVFSYIEKEKNLVLGKKISAQPTASKKIETPLRIGVVFKGMGFGGRNRDSKVEKAISR